MSDFYTETKNPATGEWETAHWMDDYFGRHRYGVKFPSGEIFDAADKRIVIRTKDDRGTQGEARIIAGR